MAPRLLPPATDWTVETEARLEQLWREDMTVNQIAYVLGVSRGAVTGKVARMRLPGRPSPLPPGWERPQRPAPAARPARPPAMPAAVTAPVRQRRAVSSTPAVSVRPPAPPATCRWLVTEDGPSRLCGDPVVERRYCAEHAGKRWVPARRAA